MKIIEVHARPKGSLFKVIIIWPVMGPVAYTLNAKELDEYCEDELFDVYESIRRDTWPHQQELIGNIERDDAKNA
jgi:hypothetical protein